MYFVVITTAPRKPGDMCHWDTVNERRLRDVGLFYGLVIPDIAVRTQHELEEISHSARFRLRDAVV